MALCVAILLTDYVVAARRAPGDDRLIKTLQQQTKEDASLAPKLAAEQKRVTGARLARKTRDNAVAWVLIAAAAAFLAFAKQQVKAREAIAARRPWTGETARAHPGQQRSHASEPPPRPRWI